MTTAAAPRNSRRGRTVFEWFWIVQYRFQQVGVLRRCVPMRNARNLVQIVKLCLIIVQIHQKTAVDLAEHGQLKAVPHRRRQHHDGNLRKFHLGGGPGRSSVGLVVTGGADEADCARSVSKALGQGALLDGVCLLVEVLEERAQCAAHESEPQARGRAKGAHLSIMS